MIKDDDKDKKTASGEAIVSPTRPDPAPAGDKPIELPPTNADLVRQIKEFRDLTTKEIAELRQKVSEMTDREKIAVERKIEAKPNKTSKASGDWLYDLFWS
jgi:hypothetical protein